MSRVHLFGQIHLAAHNLSNNALEETVSLMNLFGSKDGSAWVMRSCTMRSVGLPPAPKTPVLRHYEDFTLGPFTERFNPYEYFVEGENVITMDASEDGYLMDILLALAQPIDTASSVVVRSFDLIEDAADHHIQAELPRNHSVSRALWEIARLIDAQKNGEDGPLIWDGENIFYGEYGFTIEVSPNIDNDGNYVRNEGWLMMTRRLNEVARRVGSRVFSFGN